MSKGNSSSSSDSRSYGSEQSTVEHGEVAWGEACTPEFMAANTDAPDFESFARAGGFDISTQKGLDAILPSELDSYVNEHTSFPSWSEMKTRAFADWKRRTEAAQAGVSPRKPNPLKSAELSAEASANNQRRRSDQPVDDGD